MKKYYHGVINKNYGWELGFFDKIRGFKDGLTFFNLDINWDRYLGDHSPKFNILWIILNYKIFEFSIYYLHHRD